MRGLAAVLFLVGLSSAHGFSFYWPHWGRCPDLAVQQNFSVAQYELKWYVQAGYEIDMTQGKGRCSSAYYSLGQDGIVYVFNEQISSDSNSWVSINGTAVLADPSKDEGKLEVTFPVGFWGKTTGPYWVLGTDYKTYSVVYSCENFFFIFHYWESWLLSRLQILPDLYKENFYTAVDNVLRNHKIDPTAYVEVNQTNC